MESPQYAGSDLRVSLRPIDIKKSDAQKIETHLTQLLSEVENFSRMALGDPKLLRALGVPEAMDPTPTPLGLHIPFARFDFVFDGENIQVLELNTDGTSGFNICQWLSDNARLKPEENPCHQITSRLYQAISAHKPDAKLVCLLDFDNVTTSWEQKDLVRRWESYGHTVKRVSPDKREWVDGALIYRRALSWELRQNSHKAAPFLDDWANEKVTVVGGWSSDIGMSKVWPALFGSKYCAPTYEVTEDRVREWQNEKDNWVLKLAFDYSGHGVVRGVDLGQSAWQESLAKALAETQNGKPWVAQKFTKIPLYEGKPLELGCFFLNGNPAGFMARWGHENEKIDEHSKEVQRPVRFI